MPLVTRNKFARSRRRRIRHGLALVLVLCLMAVATILGYAMLSSATLQATSSSNALAGAIAEAEAESGVHLAMFYLLNPSNAPSHSGTGTNGTAYWTGGNNITFSPASGTTTPIPGNVSVVVTNTAANTYQIISTGSSNGGSAGGGVITRTITTTAVVETAYLIQQAGTFNSTLTVNSKDTFSNPGGMAIKSSQAVTYTGGTINGNVEAPSLSGSISGTLYPAPATPPAPTATDLHNYSTYVYQGVTYAATAVASSLSNTTLGPTTSNPLGVYVYTYTGSGSGTLTMNSNVVIAGTLLVQNAKLSVKGSGNIISPASAMPGLVIDNQLEMNGSSRGLTVNGVVYAGNGITGVGITLGDALNITGALLLNNSGVASSYSGTLTVNYSAANTTVTDLSSTNQTPTGVKLTAWSE